MHSGKKLKEGISSVLRQEWFVKKTQTEFFDHSGRYALEMHSLSCSESHL